MIGVKTTTAEFAMDALREKEVGIVLYERAGIVYALTSSDDVAQRIHAAKPVWRYDQILYHSFTTGQKDKDTVAAMLAGTFPDISAWQTR